MFCSRCGSQDVEVKIQNYNNDNERYYVSSRTVDFYKYPIEDDVTELVEQEFIGNLKICTCKTCGHTFFEDDI